MSPDDLRAACLRLRGAAEDFPFPRFPDRSAFKVGGKVFAISSPGTARCCRTHVTGGVIGPGSARPIRAGSELRD